jgi:signal transduction histidine kinase
VKKFSVSKDLLYEVLEKTPFGIIVFSKNGLIHWINEQTLNILDLHNSESEIIGKGILEVIHHPYDLTSRIRDFVSGKIGKFDMEGIFIKSKYLTIRGRTTKKGLIVTIADITMIKEAELQSLNSMLEGQELERQRLSREIHDGIGPLLSALKINLSSIEGDLDSAQVEAVSIFENAYQLIDQVSDDLRSISHNLTPKVLIDFGLQEALGALKEKMNFSKNMKLTVLFTDIPSHLDQVYELGIYRICQELINNTLKHAKASKTALQLINSNEMLRIIYEDDGIGFEIDQVKRGLGLANIENRIKALGGEWSVDSMPGKGMTATIEIPMKTNEDGEN